jgi:hypothetical protein
MTRLPLSLSLALAACGGSSSTPSTPTPKEVPTPAAWSDDLSLEQKGQYMKAVVLPKAKELFTAFDPKFANMDCKTCHGDGAEDGSFEMPDLKVPALPNTEEAFMKWLGEKPERGPMAKFMGETLEPEMAKLLGKTVFNPADGSGEFGCIACHTLVDAEGKPVEMPKHDESHADEAH